MGVNYVTLMVFGKKSMYGKTYMGIERSTFLIDTEGNIGQVWQGKS